ncbi:MAG: lytic transglycosylase domain-containing protein [Thermodesulfobacteriota bacterium]|nr:lytic transglycosylase domain-containing protein [Thermodesulfobacteriota bacterium]
MKKYLLIIFLLITSSGIADTSCGNSKNHLYNSYCYEKNKNYKMAIESLNKLSKYKDIEDFLLYRKIKLLSYRELKLKQIKNEIRKFEFNHNDSILMPKVQLIEAERMYAKKSYTILRTHLKKIRERYKLDSTDKMKFKYILARNSEKLGDEDKAFRLFKEIWIKNPSYRSKLVSKKVSSLSKKLKKEIKQKDSISRLNSLFKKRMYSQFILEAKKINSPDIKIKQAIIKLRKKQRKEGRILLIAISKGDFISTGSDSKDLEAKAEALYQLSLDDLKMSKDNSIIANNLQLILKKYPNFSKNKDAAYLAARLFTLDKNHTKSKGVYEWLIKTKSQDYLNDAFWGMGWSEYMLENYEQAINYFSTLERSDKIYYQAKGLYWKARALEQIGDIQRARNIFTKLFDNYKVGYYPYLASIKLGIKPKSKEEYLLSKGISNKLKDQIKLLRLSKANNKSRREVSSYIKKRINSANFSDYFNALESIKEFNMLVRLSYSYPSKTQYRYPKAFTRKIKTNSENFGVNKNLILGLIREESLFDPSATSRVGAMGLMQLMPATAEKIKKELKIKTTQSTYNSNMNIKLGTYYLSKLIDDFDGNLFLAIAAYNGGPANVKKWLVRFEGLDDDELVESIPFKETHGYVKRVLRSYYYYMSIE